MSVTKRIMKNFLFIISSIIFLSACYATHEEKRSDPPDDLIGTEKMVMILADVEITESALRQKQNYGHEISELKEEYYHAIFTKYEVSREQFDRSLAWYKEDLITIDKIYEDVITRLSVLESEVQLEE